ncbi:flagellar filament capping protein FliD [Opitutus sp. ER46]|uniref:flagellar filament capping protein FliD n=1 Tax=Opitutus sp. ER46 TaxID=2161864 RepID=UPI000D328215|nr:flagellar filament capping protein FliD [Opitutus sp. ER46]PTX90877.1 flagellar hook protein [Opitutus sp. ER46]
MGIQISGLLSDSAFDWKDVVDKLIAVERVPVTNLETTQANNLSEITALGDITTALQELQDSVQAMRSSNVYDMRTVSSDSSTSTWKATSSNGTSLGSYKFEIQTLASTAALQGGADIGASLASSASDLGSLTISNLPIATAVTAGTFTVDGKQISVAATDSLKDVLDRITTATGATWSYDSTSDAITLAKGSGSLVLGAANDTSNFLAAMKLANNQTGTITSSGGLGTLKTTATLVQSGLRGAIAESALDAEGNGSFTVNGVPISYNVNTDTLKSVLDRITASAANVSASYDSANDRVVLTNKTTGDMGLSVSEASGGLLGVLNLTADGAKVPTLKSGTNAVFRVNDGDWLTSSTNTLASSAHGIAGLSVTVNSTGAQTLTIESDASSMGSYVEDFISKFNAVQDMIDTYTKTSVSGSKVTTSLLSGNREVQEWGRKLRTMAFQTLTGLTGSIDHIDDLGIDFDGTTSHLKIKDTAKLTDALTNSPDDVKAFFLSGSSGMVPKMYELITNLKSSGNKEQESLRSDNKAIDDQIDRLETRIATEQARLTKAFIAMLDAQSTAQSQSDALTNAFSSKSS